MGASIFAPNRVCATAESNLFSHYESHKFARRQPGITKRRLERRRGSSPLLLLVEEVRNAEWRRASATDRLNALRILQQEVCLCSRRKCHSGFLLLLARSSYPVTPFGATPCIYF